MDRERWVQIKEIVNACLDLDAACREGYIVEACAGDVSLIAEARSLLASHSELGDFMASSVLDEMREELLTGSRIGHYQICEPIAEGGMGTVYRAVRISDFQKQVAIKLVKRGMDTGFVLRRFRYERQILAGLDHPNIARLLDGGATEDGRPYLVMEYVAGTPITEYAEQRNLTVPERLQLFRMVCSTVQYAHQNLVVHRDLKPSNILVTAEGIPKLLDFGIAKLLEPEADVTLTSLRLMTPECASPEQVRGQPITTASDIYSLGVLLYHLLTGEAPYWFTTRTPEDIARVICETEPKKPSALRPLSEDLDNVVLKAMQKEPVRRYVSVDQFAEDLRRHMEGLPISARADTFGYRARKFAGRHRAATIAAALVALSLIAGMATTLWQAQVARSERARAERRFAEVRQLANSLIFELHDAIQPLPGSITARKLLLDRGLHYLDALSKESAGDPALQRDIATGYERVGLVQGSYGNANLGDSAGALQSLQKALEIRQSIVRNSPASTGDLRALAGSLRVVAMQRMANGAPQTAATEIQKAIQISEELRRRDARDFETLSELGWDYEVYGVIQGGSMTSLGDNAGALLSFRKAIVADEAALEIDPRNENVERAIEIDYVHLSKGLFDGGNFAQGLAIQQKALEAARKLASGSSSPLRKRDVAVACNQMARCYEALGDFKQALASNLEARKIYLELAPADPANAIMQGGLAAADLNVGDMLVKNGRVREALPLMDDAVRIEEGLVARDPASVVELRRSGQFYVDRGEAREQAGMFSDAMSDLQKALIAFSARADQSPGDAPHPVDAARCHLSIARLEKRIGRNDQAAASFRKALALTEKDTGGNPAKPGVQEVAAEAYAGLGDIARARGSNPALPAAQRIDSWNEGRACYRKSLGLWPSISKPATAAQGKDANGPTRLAARLAECDRQLARLQAISSPNGP